MDRKTEKEGWLVTGRADGSSSTRRTLARSSLASSEEAQRLGSRLRLLWRWSGRVSGDMKVSLMWLVPRLKASGNGGEAFRDLLPLFTDAESAVSAMALNMCVGPLPDLQAARKV